MTKKNVGEDLSPQLPAGRRLPNELLWEVSASVRIHFLYSLNKCTLLMLVCSAITFYLCKPYKNMIKRMSKPQLKVECLWIGCNKTFPSAMALNAHLPEHTPGAVEAAELERAHQMAQQQERAQRTAELERVQLQGHGPNIATPYSPYQPGTSEEGNGFLEVDESKLQQSNSKGPTQSG